MISALSLKSNVPLFSLSSLLLYDFISGQVSDPRVSKNMKSSRARSSLQQTA